MRQTEDVSIFSWGVIVDAERLADTSLIAANTNATTTGASVFADAPSNFGFIGHDIEYPDDESLSPVMNGIIDDSTSSSSFETVSYVYCLELLVPKSHYQRTGKRKQSI